MKYDIIKDFKGSPDGHTVIEYTKGQEGVELEGELAKVALEEKWVKVSKAAAKEAKAKEEAEIKAREEAEAKAKEEAEAARAESIAALEQEINQLEDDLARADEAEAPAIVAQVEARRQQLADRLSA